MTTNIEDLPCPECGRTFGVHTLTEYRAHTAGQRQRAFATTDPEMRPLPARTRIVDHVDVAAVVMDATDGDNNPIVLPGVRFDFYSSADGAQPPVLFVSDDPDLFRGLAKLIASACNTAPMSARRRLQQIKRGDS